MNYISKKRNLKIYSKMLQDFNLTVVTNFKYLILFFCCTFIAGFCEHSNEHNEPVDSIKVGEFLNQLSRCWLLKKHSALCSWSGYVFISVY
jgi:hypothetical protein